MFGRFLWGLVIGVALGFMFKPQLQRMLDALREVIKKNSGRNKD